MRRWWGALALLGLTGCGLLREAPVEQAVSVREYGLPSSALEHPRTRAWTRRFCDKLARRSPAEIGIAPAQPILPRMQAILVAYGLPAALSAVPAIESRYQPLARGSHGELGLWQLRPGTARRWGLEVSRARDDRAHLDRSTQGAARYLAFLHARYDDWPLALAAYNAGEGRVDRALASRPGASFWDLADGGVLPQVSREYVPKILAVVRVTGDPAACQS
jgi:membrane-bound lytic murein transglycosylase D